MNRATTTWRSGLSMLTRPLSNVDNGAVSNHVGFRTDNLIGRTFNYYFVAIGRHRFQVLASQNHISVDMPEFTLDHVYHPFSKLSLFERCGRQNMTGRNSGKSHRSVASLWQVT